MRQLLPVLQENTQALVESAERQLGPGLQLFFLVRAHDALKRILLAVNEVYDPADKREDLTVIPGLEWLPADFVARISYILEGPFHGRGAVERAKLFERLASEVLEVTRPLMPAT